MVCEAELAAMEELTRIGDTLPVLLPFANDIRAKMQHRKRRAGYNAEKHLTDRYVLSYNLWNEPHLDTADKSKCRSPPQALL